jgi:hypothetical protein
MRLAMTASVRKKQTSNISLINHSKERLGKGTFCLALQINGYFFYADKSSNNHYKTTHMSKPIHDKVSYTR